MIVPTLLFRDQPKRLSATSHENSESSERDVSRPRFTVACHPHLPQLACSDGYSVTLFEWDPSPDSAPQGHAHIRDPTTQDLLGLVKGLVATSRGMLGDSLLLQQKEQMSRIFGKGESLVTGSRGDRTLDFLASIANGDLELNDAAVMSSTLKTLGADSAHPRGGSGRSPISSPSAARRDKGSLSASVPLLQAAVGMLLTCEPFVPFNGMLPKTKSLELNEVSAYRSELEAATNRLLSTIFKVVSELSVSGSTSPIADRPIETNALSQDFITSLLKLVAFDKLKQSRIDLSVSISNSILLGFLSGLSKVQRNFATLRRDRHTLKSLKLFTDWVTTSLLDVYNLLEEMVCVLDSTYSTRHSVLGDVLQSGRTTTSMQFEKHPTPNCVQCLAPSLNAALSIVSALWQDVKRSRDLAKSFRHPPVSSARASATSSSAGRGNWAPEVARLFKQFKKSSANASTTLKALHYYIYHLLSSSKQPSTPKKLPLSLPKDGKPFTYAAARNDIRSMLDQLLRYDMRGVMDVVSGCVQECGGGGGGDEAEKDGQLAVSMSADRLSDILDSSIVNRRDFASYICVRSEPARFIVGVLGDLMASYFTNQEILVLMSSDTTVSARHAELSRTKLSVALREQDLTDVWTVERAVNLLLLSGKWEKACDFVVELGDWRKAFVLAVIFAVHSERVAKRRGESLHSSAMAVGDILSNFSHHLATSNILKVLSSLHKKAVKPSNRFADSGDSDVDPSLGRVCEQFILETFHVCALSGVDLVLRSCADHCLKELVSLTAGLSTRVHPGFYLPAPPLFYIQPTLTEEVSIWPPLGPVQVS